MKVIVRLEPTVPKCVQDKTNNSPDCWPESLNTISKASHHWFLFICIVFIIIFRIHFILYTYVSEPYQERYVLKGHNPSNHSISQTFVRLMQNLEKCQTVFRHPGEREKRREQVCQ